MQYAGGKLQKKLKKAVDKPFCLCYNAYIEISAKGKAYVRIRYDDGYDEDVHVPHVHVLSCLSSDVFFGFL